jgi:glutathione S-transferase
MDPLAEPIVLHVDSFYISPYVCAAFVALTEKGLKFEVREVKLHEGDQKTATFVAASVTARVPLLEHGAFQLSESSAIVEYLEEIFPPPRYPALLPANPRERARARQIMAWIRSDLMPIRQERSMETVIYTPATTPLSPAGQAAAAKVIAAAIAFLPEGRTSLFDTFTIADLDLAIMLQRLIASGDPVPAPLQAFVAAQWQRPSVRAFVDRPRAPYIRY